MTEILTEHKHVRVTKAVNFNVNVEAVAYLKNSIMVFAGIHISLKIDIYINIEKVNNYETGNLVNEIDQEKIDP